jgi:hypothetical protein
VDDEITPMTDEEADLFRRWRFGQLPEAIDRDSLTTSADVRVVQPPDPVAEWRRRADG